MEELEVDPAALLLDQAIEGKRQGNAIVELADVVQVVDRGTGAEIVAIAGGEGVAEAVHQEIGLLLAEPLDAGGLEVVTPVAGEQGNLALQPLEVVGNGMIAFETQDELDTRQHRLRQIRVEVAEGGAQLLAEQVLDAQPQFGGEDVPRHEDQAGVELAEAILAHEQSYPASLADVEDAQRRLHQLVDVDLEEVVARIDLENLQQLLAVVPLGVEAGDLHHRLQLAAQDRHVARRLVVDRGGEQAQEAMFADHPALLIVSIDGDIVGIAGAPGRGGRSWQTTAVAST